MRFATNGGSEAMRIDSSGNIGIGTTSITNVQTPTLQLGTNRGAVAIGTGDIQDNGSTLDIGSARPISFSISGSEKARIDLSGNVGIGVTPESYQELYRALQVGNTALIGRHSGGTSEMYLTANSYYDGAWKYIVSDEASVISQSAGVISFLNAASGTADATISWSEAMRIDSSGNLLVGKTSADFGATAGVELRGDGRVATGRAGESAVFNRLTSDGDIVLFRKDGSEVGSIGTQSGNPYIGGTNRGIRFDSAQIIPADMTASGSNSDNSIDIGDSGVRFKDLYLSGNAYADNFIGTDDGDTFIAMTGSDVMRFFTGNSEGARLDASGNLLVGKTSADVTTQGIVLRGGTGESYFSRTNDNPVYINRNTSDGGLISFRKDGSTVGSIGSSATGSGSMIVGNGTIGIMFRSDLTGSAFIAANPSTSAQLDNTLDIGHSAIRFDDIYATNGDIQTSDRNEKQDIEALSDAEQRVAVAAKGLLRKFRWISSVEEKGDEARTHFGIIAQDLQAAFAAEGLDAGDYAMFINTTWTDEETGEERSRMGVRYSQLLAFIIAAI
jgi:hypothetical protein